MTRWERKLCGCLLYTYPREFRLEYQTEILQAWDDQLQEETGHKRLFFCCAAAADMLSTAIKERYHVMLQDFIHSYRRLRTQPGTALIAILSLALGIGANTAMFSILYGALLRPLPYRDAERLVVVNTVNLKASRDRNFSWATSADFLDWQKQSRTLTDWHMCTSPGTRTVSGGGLPERISTQNITPGLLTALGVKPVTGRFFGPEEALEDKFVLISEEFWNRRFGAAPDIAGQKLILEGKPAIILGVIPARFELFSSPGAVDVYMTIDFARGEWVQRKIPWLLALAKRKPDVTLELAQKEMDGIAASLAQAYPDTNLDRGAWVRHLAEASSGNQGSILYPLFGAVAFILLIACTNVANLLLARATARRREISVRAALGAGRGRLFAELLMDGLCLAIPGVFCGLLLAKAGIVSFRAMAPDRFPGSDTVELNSVALLFTVVTGFLAGVLSALFPAVQASQTDLTESLKEGGRGSAGRNRQRVRTVLVGGQIALAMVLLIGAGLTLNTVLRMQNHPLGFDSENITVARFDFAGSRYANMAPKREIDMRYVEPPVLQAMEHMLREVRALPGVESAAMTATVPMAYSGVTGVSVRVAGRTTEEKPQQYAGFSPATTSFFETLRIPLRKGRYLNDSDTVAGQWVAVVNEAFVRTYFPQGEALDQEILLQAGPEERPRRIVGVVSDVILFRLKEPTAPMVYTSYHQQVREIPGNFQAARLRPALVVRSAIQGQPDGQTLARIMARFDPQTPVFDVKPLETYMAERGSPYRFYANTLALFSAIAVILAMVGIYGLMSYAVTDRVHEMGIRLALGASRRQLIRLIAAAGVKLALGGLTIGAAGALLTTRFLEWMLFGVKPWDPATFVLTALLLFAVAMSATLVPAWRATRVDPLLALRRE